MQKVCKKTENLFKNHARNKRRNCKTCNKAYIKIYFSVSSSCFDDFFSLQETYIMNNCQLNEMQRHGSNYLPINVDNIHFFTAHYTSFAFFEAPKYARKLLCVYNKYSFKESSQNLKFFHLHRYFIKKSF